MISKPLRVPYGAVATSQPLASSAGLKMLLDGGNAVDAAVAAAAVLNVVEPMSTGIGGDMFALVYSAGSKELVGLNASGRAPSGIDADQVIKMGYESMPASGMLPVTVPGALDGWDMLIERFGNLSLKEVLSPAIDYAEKGFPVTMRIAGHWKDAESQLRSHPDSAANYLSSGAAPREGEMFRQKGMAKTFREIAREGKDTFYSGKIARNIAGFSDDNLGYLALSDLEEHRSTWERPISTGFKDVNLYELPPNSHGVVALEALNIIKGFDLDQYVHNSPEYLHLVIESLKLAFEDGWKHIADPEMEQIPLERMISEDHASGLRDRIGKDAMQGPYFPYSNDTVYLTAVDKERNACSFINSLYMSFGSGMVVGDTGICLQNRGALFSLLDGHPNRLEPGKRPYHTIIPAMVLDRERLARLSFGVMGGFMQPQGHLQVFLNVYQHRMEIQEAIDAERVMFMEGKKIAIEGGLLEKRKAPLEQLGHLIDAEMSMWTEGFGGGQGIMIDYDEDCLTAGSDWRKDGCATGY